MNKERMIEIVKNQIAIDMNCDLKDLEREGISFCEARLNEGRRMFNKQNPFLEVVAFRNRIIVSAEKNLLKKVKPLLESKSREDIFVAPFLYGHSIYFIPDPNKTRKCSCPDNFSFEIKKGHEIHELYKLSGFENALMYDVNHPRPDVLAICAIHNDEVVAIAGASADSKTMWQIGIDVLPDFRGKGLATSLVSNLALLIIELGHVPYYGAASSNIASQAVAFKSGFVPSWMCSYKNIFDGSSPYNTILNDSNKFSI